MMDELSSSFIVSQMILGVPIICSLLALNTDVYLVFFWYNMAIANDIGAIIVCLSLFHNT